MFITTSAQQQDHIMSAPNEDEGDRLAHSMSAAKRTQMSKTNKDKLTDASQHPTILRYQLFTTLKLPNRVINVFASVV